MVCPFFILLHFKYKIALALCFGKPNSFFLKQPSVDQKTLPCFPENLQTSHGGRGAWPPRRRSWPAPRSCGPELVAGACCALRAVWCGRFAGQRDLGEVQLPLTSKPSFLAIERHCLCFADIGPKRFGRGSKPSTPLVNSKIDGKPMFIHPKVEP